MNFTPIYGKYFFIEFFKKNNVAVMPVKALFDFITDPTVNEKNINEYLDKMSKIMEDKPVDIDPEQQIEEEVFKNAYIPQRLAEVKQLLKLCIEKITGGIPPTVFKILIRNFMIINSNV